MAWSKLKSMFVVSDQPAQSTDDLMKDLEKYQLPEGEAAALPDGTSAQMLSGQIDFQGLYDQAGIPNTDEVEALERFLIGLDESLPASGEGGGGEGVPGRDRQGRQGRHHRRGPQDHGGARGGGGEARRHRARRSASGKR